MASILQQSTYVRSFQMDSTGKSPVVTLSKAGGAFAAAAGVVAEIGNTWYKITLTNVDTNTAGVLAYHVTASGAADVDFFDEVVAQSQLTALSIGDTTSYAPNRNAMIEMAFRKVRALDPTDTLKGYQLTTGIQALNMIVRQYDIEDTHVWTMGTAPFNLPLQEHIGVYTSTEDLPTNIMEITKATLRTPTGEDTPLKILTHRGYEAIPNKFETGLPQAIYLNRHRDPASQSLYVWPLPADVGTQSEVTVSAVNYQCIRTHTSDSTTQPGTGANWRLYWQVGGSSGSAWVTATAYTATTSIRVWYKRPLADFTAANDNPDLPPGLSRMLLLRLCADLAFDTGKSMEFEDRLNRRALEAERRTFRKANKEQTDDTKHHVEYF